MKKFYLFLSLLAIGFSAKAVPGTVENFDRPDYRDAFIFVERGVEFAVFPDGQFDFFFNPRGNFNRVPSQFNYSFNSGYNYGPFVQYDDYGAVIQIENVPVYYDYYGRILQAGRVKIGYNAFGMVNRIGNMFLHYNHYDQFTHTSGFINSRNAHYIYRPWHQHYMRPHSHVVVYHQPYRLYYTPNRMKYNQYKRYYNNNYRDGSFQKSYYQPGERVTTYHRGRRGETPREVRTAVSDSREAVNTRAERNINRQSETRNMPANRRMDTRPSTSQIEDHNIQRTSEAQMRTSRLENARAERAVEAQKNAERARAERSNVQRSERAERSGVQRSERAQRRNIDNNPAREVQAQTRRTETPAEVNNASQVRAAESAPTRGNRSSRGRQ